MTVDVSALLAKAESALGKPYVFGAAGPNTFDCSGLVTWAFGAFGISLPHASTQQATYGTAVSTSDIQAGDLVFSDWGDGSNSHVGIAVSANQIIDAPHTGAVVRFDDLNSTYLAHVTAVRRLSDVTGATATTSIVGGATGALSGVFGGISSALGLDAAKSAAQDVAGMVHGALWLFNPKNWVRLVAMGGAVAALVLGVVFLGREVR